MSDKRQLFSENAKRVLALAQEEAEQRGRKAIDTEHLLLGLLREEEGVVGQFLQALGLDFRQVKSVVQSTKLRRFSPRGSRLLDIAQEEADLRAGGYIDIEHILLALLRDGDGGILQALGLDTEQVEALLVMTDDRWPLRDNQTTSTVEPKPLLVLDENGNILSCNKSARDILDEHETDLWNHLGQT